MKVVSPALLLTGILLLLGITSCGSSASVQTRASAPAVVATSTTTDAGTLPFTQPTAADRRFAGGLGARCHAIVSGLARLPNPLTLADQASFSDREARLLLRLSVSARTLTPPGDLTRVWRSYTSALRSAITDDGFIADAARAQHGESVAYWLSKRAAAITAMKHSAGLLNAPTCRP